ncbi:hypothetical protein D8674_019737 [Pyrus ussuriensis x Pyrus communis]|uniref:Aminotransferase-like plant mobile domain-containing protein n=1 Tax=Pyrus ussuriensis x Pyrus communis TaxID=2448454 RepID=A0A5N5G8D9_9ROSA|nr:hypothetical protein D8674_019737 [Pyrus ussuriensis x Pyrus communis]
MEKYFNGDLDRELVMAVLRFQCSAINSMVPPFGPLGSTVLNMTAILGTSPTGLSIDISLAGYKFDSDLKTIFEERVVEVWTKGDQKPLEEEVYHPNFLARQLGYLQGCPLPFLSSCSLLSRERISSSSERECKITENENLVSRYGNTFAEWWKAYTKDFFHTRTIKKAEVVVIAATEKKLALPSKRVAAAMPTPPSKRSCPKAKTAEDIPQPKKHVKKLAQKEDISLHLPVVEASVAVQLNPTIELAINLIVERLANSAPAFAHAEAGSDVESESPQLVKRSRPTEKYAFNLQPVVETASRVEPPSVEAGLDAVGALLGESEVTAETLRAFRAENDLKAATVVQETLCPKVEVLKAKKEQLADLDRQITELQNPRSSNKSCLTEYVASVKWIEQLKMDKRNRQAEVTMGEMRWLELKATLEAFLPSS